MATYTDSTYDTGVGWSFGLEIDGIEIKEIQEVDGLKLESDEIELKHNTPDGKYVNKRLPGRKKAGELTFTRGVTHDKGWETWIKHVFDGKMKDARKHGTIKIYNYENAVVREFVFHNGWPKSIEFSSLKAGDTSLLTEKLVMVHEGLEPAP
ncbi:MAG TPA: phage tail protein [Acidimicrobiales bacterium]|nr:phage tail protein [Acidimicrobiales bacterium]